MRFNPTKSIVLISLLLQLLTALWRSWVFLQLRRYPTPVTLPVFLAVVSLTGLPLPSSGLPSSKVRNPPSLVFPSRSLPTTHPTSYFGQSLLLFPLLHRYSQVEHNSFAKYIHDILGMQFFPVLDFKQLANKDSSKSDDLKLALEQVLNGDYDASGKGPHSPYISFVRRAVSLYSAAHFGRDDHDLWITEFLLIMACISLYHARVSSPLSCNKDVTIFQSNVRNAVANLVGKPVRMVLLPQVAYEALTHLIILKTIFTFFKGHSNLFINLLNSAILPPPILTVTASVCVGRAVSVNGISSISFTAMGGFNEQKLILTPPVVAQSLSVCLANSASASVRNSSEVQFAQPQS